MSYENKNLFSNWLNRQCKKSKIRSHEITGISQVALVVKKPCANAGDLDTGSIPELGNPCRRKWQPTPVFFFFNWRLITLQYCSGFCHKLTWISHGCTCVPHPETPSHLPSHPIPQDHPSAPALSTLSHALKLDWQSSSHMVIYMF